MSEIKPRFFLVRPDKPDKPIALIAEDELPPGIVIHGLPQNFKMSDTGGMTSVGEVPSRGVIYSVTINDVAKGRVRLGDKKHGPQKTEGKVYCTHWLRTGVCAYESQGGCMYKHEYPPDEETWRKCGFARPPAEWYRLMAKKNKDKASSHKSLNWRKPRDTSKHGVHNDENGTSVVDTPGIFKNATESASVTPASSVAGETVSETSQTVKKLTEKLENAIKSTNGGSDPITPPSVCRNIDFERFGPASFNYKYDAPPHTPTERFTSRSRRLFESKGPNNHFTLWEEPHGRLREKQ